MILHHGSGRGGDTSYYTTAVVVVILQSRARSHTCADRSVDMVVMHRHYAPPRPLPGTPRLQILLPSQKDVSPARRLLSRASCRDVSERSGKGG